MPLKIKFIYKLKFRNKISFILPVAVPVPDPDAVGACVVVVVEDDTTTGLIVVVGRVIKGLNVVVGRAKIGLNVVVVGGKVANVEKFLNVVVVGQVVVGERVTEKIVGVSLGADEPGRTSRLN